MKCKECMHSIYRGDTCFFPHEDGCPQDFEGAFDLKNNIEKLYEDFYKLEDEIKTALDTTYYKIYHIDTIMDEDKLSALKAGILRFKITDIGLN